MAATTPIATPNPAHRLLPINAKLRQVIAGSRAAGGFGDKEIGGKLKMLPLALVGDTLYAKIEVLGKRLSRSHLPQDSIVIINMIKSFPTAKRGPATLDSFKQPSA